MEISKAHGKQYDLTNKFKGGPKCPKGVLLKFVAGGSSVK